MRRISDGRKQRKVCACSTFLRRPAQATETTAASSSSSSNGSNTSSSCSSCSSSNSSPGCRTPTSPIPSTSSGKSPAQSNSPAQSSSPTQRRSPTQSSSQQPQGIMGETQPASTNDNDNRAATGFRHRTENNKSTKTQISNKIKKNSRKCLSPLGAGMPYPGECVGFNLTYKKCAPQNCKRRGGPGGSEVAWVGVIQSRPPPPPMNAGWCTLRHPESPGSDPRVT